MSGITATADGGFVAVANDDDFTASTVPSVFTSDDGERWTAMPSGTPHLAGVAPLGAGVIGWQNFWQDPGYGVWTSADLATWTQVEAYDNFYAERMVAGAGRVFATAGNSQASALFSAPVSSPD